MCAVLVATAIAQPPQSSIDGSYIFAWAADADGADSDFLAVIDGSPASATYGRVLKRYRSA